jgi:Spherulation-specific family 4
LPRRLADQSGPWPVAPAPPAPAPLAPARPPPSDGPRPPRLVVPAYFHPAVAPGDWAALARAASGVRLVILNPASGPGDGPDPVHQRALEPLRAAGVAVAGYVDTNYGQRPRRDALAEISRYRDWYGVDGVLFDRVSAGREDLRHYAGLARRARQLGAQTVVFNHGVHPYPGYARHADVLGTFEGPWPVYLEQAMPQWTRDWPADRFYHVVYAVPGPQLATALLLAARRRAGCVYVTDRDGGNPYDGLPAGLPGAGGPDPVSPDPVSPGRPEQPGP